MKRIICILLVLVTLMSCFALSTSANDVLVRSDEGRLPFDDVKAGAWYEAGVEFCYVNGIINGMNEYTFAPGSALTRAQFVTMLANLEDVDVNAYAATHFTDVKANHWFYGAVSWAYEVGLVAGTSATKFSPNATISRETISRIMWLYMKDKYNVEVPKDVLSKFTDKSKVSAWAEEGMRYMVASGLISGMTETTLAPRSNLTRAQAARILTVYLQDYLYGECEHRFKVQDHCVDAPTCEKCEMTEGLATGHLLTEYSCTKGGVCEICKAEVKPSLRVHNFKAATCTLPATCTDCGSTRGKAKGHTWKVATCTVPKTCTACKTTEGKAKGHTTQNGICKNCNSEVFKSEMHRIGYYMVKKGTPDGNGHYTYDDFFEHEGGDVGYSMLYYDAKEFKLAFTYSYIWQSSGSFIVVGVEIDKISDKYTFVTEYFEDLEVVCSASGTLSAAAVKPGVTDLKLIDYSGPAADKAWFEQVSEMTLESCLKSTDYLLDSLCDSGVEVFNFNNIKY